MHWLAFGGGIKLDDLMVPESAGSYPPPPMTTESFTSSGYYSNFPITQWPRVRAAQGGDSAKASRAIDGICKDYWYPIYAFLRRDGHSPQDAEDLTQTFFEKLLAENFLLSVDEEAGRLRSYLLAVLKHIVRDGFRHHHARKRGGRFQHVSIDSMAASELYALEPLEGRDPEWLYAHAWALELVGAVREKLRAAYEMNGRAEVFDELLPFLMWDEEPPSHREIACRLGSSEAGSRILIHRLRLKFRELLRDEVAYTVLSPEEIPGELIWLQRVLTTR